MRRHRPGWIKARYGERGALWTAVTCHRFGRSGLVRAVGYEPLFVATRIASKSSGIVLPPPRRQAAMTESGVKPPHSRALRAFTLYPTLLHPLTHCDSICNDTPPHHGTLHHPRPQKSGPHGPLLHLTVQCEINSLKAWCGSPLRAAWLLDPLRQALRSSSRARPAMRLPC